MDTSPDSDSAELLKYFRGFAKVPLSRITAGQFYEKNVSQYVTLLKNGQCSREDPLHTIAVSISAESLSAALLRADLDQSVIYDPRKIPNLFPDANMICLQGNDLLEAAKRYLLPGQKWWSVRLYTDDIPERLQNYLKFTYTIASPLQDVEILRHIWTQGIKNRDVWKAKIGYTNFSFVKRMYEHVHLNEAFGALLPYTGLWESFKCRQLEHVVESHCYEEMVHYLQQIFSIWSVAPADQIDAWSVRKVEGLMPRYSKADKMEIAGLIDNGKLFPLIGNDSDREQVKTRLLTVPGRILSLRLFFSDALCFRQVSHVLWELSGKSRKLSVCQSLLHSWCNVMERKWFVQVSEDDFEVVTAAESLPVEKAESQAALISLLQLWMAAFRYFIIPRLGRQNKKPTPQPILSLKGKTECQKVARKLGFYFQHSLTRDSYVPVFQYMSETLINNPQNVAKNSKGLAEGFRKLYPSIMANDIPALSTDSTEFKARFRCGRPLENDYQELRSTFFYKNIFGSMRSERLYPTPFAVLRDIFISFLGRTYEQIDEQDVEEERVEEERVEEERVAEEPVEEETEEDMDADSISLESHPPGTPPMPPPRENHVRTNAPYHTPPLAAGFEDETCIGPLNKRSMLVVQRKVVDILKVWLQSGNPDLLVFFAFDSRVYYKFLLKDEHEQRTAIKELSKSCYFVSIEDHQLQTISPERVHEAALANRLILMGHRNYSGQTKFAPDGEPSNGNVISYEDLMEYISAYDLRTGKRRLDKKAQIESRKSNKQEHVYTFDPVDEEL